LVLREEGLPLDPEVIEVRDAATAQALKFIGSPTIRVDGLDIEPACRTATAIGLACRRYVGGLPSAEMIRAALREARNDV
jgi:hypothetical protein